MSIDLDRYRTVLISPKKDFGTEEQVFTAAGCAGPSSKNFLLFNYDLLAVILDATGAIFWPPTLYLVGVAGRSRSATGDTVRTYSESLVVFLNFLSSRGLSPSDVTEQQWAAFRTHLRRGAQEYALNTVNLHLSVAASYLRWGQESGYVCSQIGLQLMTKQGDGWSNRHRYRHTSSGVQNVQLPSVKRIPQFVSNADFRRLLADAPLPYRLQFKWAICTGLRRFEICSLRVSDVYLAKPIDKKSCSLVQLELVRKGGRIRSVWAPASLIDETRWYILVDRVRPSPGFEDDVFLNSRGRRLCRNSLTRKFREVAIRNNVNATLHHLRHTFAIEVLIRLQQYEDDGEPINALKTLQILMGHSSLETTETYLNAMEVTSDAVADTLGYLYGASL